MLLHKAHGGVREPFLFMRIDAGCRASLKAPGTGETQGHLDECWYKIDTGCVSFYGRNVKLWLQTPWAHAPN